jgi:hypothetical protein
MGGFLTRDHQLNTNIFADTSPYPILNTSALYRSASTCTHENIGNALQQY